MYLIFFIVIIMLGIYAINKKDQVYRLKNEKRELEKRLGLSENDDIYTCDKTVFTDDVLVQTGSTGGAVSDDMPLQSESAKDALQDDVPLKTENTEDTASDEYLPSCIKSNEGSCGKPESNDGKNIIIVAIGAIFVVLSSIALLLSTWSVMPEFVKTVIMLIAIAFFYGCSKASDKYIDNKLIANIFFYITMAYIPVCLFSISAFGLIGDYLSLRGAGRYLYFTAISIIVSLIYYAGAKSRNSRVLFDGSIIAQFLAAAILGFIIEENIFISISLALVYNIVIMLIARSEVVGRFFISVPWMTLALSAVFIWLYPNDIYAALAIVLLSANFAFLYAKGKGVCTAYVYQLLIIGLGLYVIHFGNAPLSLALRQILLLTYAGCIFAAQKAIYYLIDTKQLNKVCDVVFGAFLTFVYITYLSDRFVFIKSWMLAFAAAVFMTYAYANVAETRKHKIFAASVFSVFMCVGILGMLNFIDAGYNLLAAGSLILFIFPLVLDRFVLKGRITVLRRAVHISFYVLGIILYFICKYETSYIVTYSLAVFLLFICNFINRRGAGASKYIMYFGFYAFLQSLFHAYPYSNALDVYMLMAGALITCVAELRFKSLRDGCSGAYFALAQIVVFLGIISHGSYIFDAYVPVVSALTFSAIFVICRRINGSSPLYDLIPVYGSAIVCALLDAGWVLSMTVSAIASFLLLILSFNREKLLNMYRLASIVYLIISVCYAINIYAALSILLSWLLVNLIFEENANMRSILEVAVYVSLFVLYTNIIFDLKFLNQPLFVTIGVILTALAVIEGVLSEHLKELDCTVLQYVVYSVAYLIAAVLCTDWIDGIILITFAVAMLLIGYRCRLKAVYRSGMISAPVCAVIIVNEFIADIPWWIYLMLSGIAMIGFALRKEMASRYSASNDNQQNMNIQPEACKQNEASDTTLGDIQSSRQTEEDYDDNKKC